jgi:Fe-S oxidoreductase
MFPDFTLMAGGHNPRPSRKERVRNRFMHKLKYHLDRYNLDGCVGCGRCISKCPVNIDITQIIKDLKEVGQNA